MMPDAITPAATPATAPPEDALHRRAAAQRHLREEGARLAGVLAHRARRAVEIGLEPQSVAAFQVGSDSLADRFGLTPHVPAAAPATPAARAEG